MIGFVKTQEKGFWGIRMKYKTRERLCLIYQIPLWIILSPLILALTFPHIFYGLFMTGLIILWGASVYCIVGSLEGVQFCYDYADWWYR